MARGKETSCTAVDSNRSSQRPTFSVCIHIILGWSNIIAVNHRSTFRMFDQPLHLHLVIYQWLISITNVDLQIMCGESVCQACYWGCDWINMLKCNNNHQYILRTKISVVLVKSFWVKHYTGKSKRLGTIPLSVSAKLVARHRIRAPTLWMIKLIISQWFWSSWSNKSCPDL